ncbi:hypothetical protein Pelo_18508 [Pelomyxa schiedti]|nr:hypothetical protein Pelo_18508 [Pelomyxa schiedti]
MSDYDFTARSPTTKRHRTHAASKSGDITRSLAGAGMCRDQFAALLASSLLRCGAASPARPAASNSPLMLSMWRDFGGSSSCGASSSRGPAAEFVISVGPRRGWASVAISLSVSPATLGVARPPAVAHRLDTRQLAKWIGPDEYLWQVRSIDATAATANYFPREPAPSSVYAFCTPAAATEEEAESATAKSDAGCLITQKEGVLQTFARLDAGIINSKWVVAWLWASDYVLVLHRVIHCSDNDRTGSGRFECVWLGMEAKGSIRVVLNQSNPDEALIMSCINDKAQFTLLDLPMTYNTGRPAVLMSIATQWPREEGVSAVDALKELFIMRNRAGQPVFIYSNSRAVYYVDSCTGAKNQLTKLTGRSLLSQW